MIRWLAAIAALALAAFGASLGAQRASRPDDAVTVVPGGRLAGDEPGRRGATYYALEGRSRRVITRYLDGTMAVAERADDGDVLTRLEGGDGNEMNRLRIDRHGFGGDVVQIDVPLEPPIQLLLKAEVHPTLDWAAHQSHQLHRDDVISSSGLYWRDGLVRRRGRGSALHELEEIRSIETVWADGLSATTGPVHSHQGDVFDGRPVRGDVLVTKLVRNGVELGVANYLTRERIYAWSFPGITEGMVATEHMASRYGDWPFTPDMVWMNLQAIALYQMKTTIDARGFMAQRAEPTPLQAVSRFFAPTLSANEPGCDGLHWLDGTILRFCCDIHDACYAKIGCNSSSWWEFWSSWRCDACNVSAVWCFATGTTYGPFYQSPW